MDDRRFSSSRIFKDIMYLNIPSFKQLSKPAASIIKCKWFWVSTSPIFWQPLFDCQLTVIPWKIASNESYKIQFWNLNTFNIQILNFKNIFFCGINSTVFTSLTTIQWLKIFYDIDKWINKNTISMSEFNLIAFWMRVWFCMQSKLIVSGGVLMKFFRYQVAGYGKDIFWTFWQLIVKRKGNC